jgi:2-polyprenyl-6-methoxyphenol hydroxylase-like FAD-dependent oxidoreductase
VGQAAIGAVHLLLAGRDGTIRGGGGDPGLRHGGEPLAGADARPEGLRFAGWHDPIPALLEAADPGAVLHHDLYELPPLKTYTSGRVVLAGDAAHAMTPNLGQGACQALEDAVVLGQVMTDGDGLYAYDRKRRPRTQMITRRSRRMGAVGQWASPAAVSLRNTALRLLPSSSFSRSLAPVLDWAA